MRDRAIDNDLLSRLIKHNNGLGIKRMLKSISYERAAELPYVFNIIDSIESNKKLLVLDVGTGDSVLPTFLVNNANVHITCLDKYDWVNVQRNYASRTLDKDKFPDIEIEKKDLFDFKTNILFDVITCISVIEHFPGNTDSDAIQYMADLLAPGGLLIVTTPVNEGFPKDFYKEEAVYGKYEGGSRFYQRHYDMEGIQNRLIDASGLKEVKRIYFGEYGYPVGQKFLFPSWKKNPLKIFYKWASPILANKYLTYSDLPISNSSMSVDTASGVILVLQKP